MDWIGCVRAVINLRLRCYEAVRQLTDLAIELRSQSRQRSCSSISLHFATAYDRFCRLREVVAMSEKLWEAVFNVMASLA